MGKSTTDTTPGQEGAPLNMFEGKMGRRQAMGGILQLLGLKVAADATNVMAQDQAVAIATPNNNPRTVGSVESIEKTGFGLAIDTLRKDIRKLQPELDKLGVDSLSFLKLLDKIDEVAEKWIAETNKALDMAFNNLKKLHDGLPNTDKRLPNLTSKGLEIPKLKETLGEDWNLLKVIGYILRLKEEYKSETTLINQGYFDQILSTINKSTLALYTNMEAAGKGFGKITSPEFKALQEKLKTIILITRGAPIIGPKQPEIAPEKGIAYVGLDKFSPRAGYPKWDISSELTPVEGDKIRILVGGQDHPMSFKFNADKNSGEVIFEVLEGDLDVVGKAQPIGLRIGDKFISPSLGTKIKKGTYKIPYKTEVGTSVEIIIHTSMAANPKKKELLPIFRVGHRSK